MPTATYYPNTTNCGGWGGDDDTAPPTTLAMDTEAALIAAELNTISADDDNSIEYAAGANAGHHIRFKITEATPTGLALTFKGCQGYVTEAGYYLYIWNFTTTAWVEVAHHHEAVKTTVTGGITGASCASYLDGTGYVHATVMAPGVEGSKAITYFGKLVVTTADPGTDPVGFFVVG